MNRRELTEVLFRVCGIYLTTMAIPWILMSALTFTVAYPRYTGAMIGTGLVAIGSAIMIWSYAPRLAEYVEKKWPSVTPPTPAYWRPIAFTIVGLLSVLDAFQELVDLVTRRFTVDAEPLPSWAQVATRLLFGLFVIFWLEPLILHFRKLLQRQ